MPKKNDFVDIPIPVNILWENILMIPLFGVVDTRRAQETMESMLKKIEETEAKTIILDITGVAAMDTAVAGHILKIAKACRLMGADCILSGISPHIAQTMVNIGVDLKDIVAKSTLKDALEEAFDKVGCEVVEKRK